MICLRFILVLLLAALHPAAAELHYSGIRVYPVAFDLEGTYLNPAADQLQHTWPAAWDAAPWINPFYGGAMIATSGSLRPVIAAPPSGNGDGRVVNLVSGVLIGPASLFATGDNGSDRHTGSGAGEFTPGVPGFIGFAMEPASGGPACYGWIRLTIHNNGTGIIHDWAWEDTGTPIAAGFTGIPEPASPALLLLTIAATLRIRRRRRPSGWGLHSAPAPERSSRL